MQGLWGWRVMRQEGPHFQQSRQREKGEGEGGGSGTWKKAQTWGYFADRIKRWVSCGEVGEESGTVRGLCEKRTGLRSG